ncbi:MAG: DNA internalization-related competence protein ComEC/Rec2 [Lachnospiraceae bacterium]|nr:DNA internalization-related competence protein ComEC/Rec2 [Lachnospiraceae bacterium]
MIKRPLLWMAAAFVLGICSGSSNMIGFQLLPVILFLFILIGFSFFFPEFQKRERFLWSLPLLFLGGMLRYQQAQKPEELEAYLQEERSVAVCGVVTERIPYDGYERLVLEKAVVELLGEETEQKTAEQWDTPEAEEKEAEGEQTAEKKQIRGMYGLVVYVEDAQEVRPGCRIWLTGTLQVLTTPANPGQYDEESYWRAQGVSAKLQAESLRVGENTYGVIRRGMEQLKKKMQAVFQEVLPKKEAGILNAMLLAEKSTLDRDIKELYQQTGISHILAVSGLHFSLIAMGGYRLLKRIRAGAKLSLLLGVLIVLFYGILTGFGVSVQRAAMMLLASFLAWIPGKTYDAPSAMALAAVVILLKEPLQLFQAGFLLSFGAVIGILLFAEYFKNCHLEVIGVSISVQLVLIPVMLWFYYELSVYSILFNLLLLPFMSLLLGLAVAIGTIGLGCIKAAQFLAGGAYYLLNFYEWVCKFNEQLPNPMFCYGRPSAGEIVVYYLLVLVFFLLGRKWQKKRVLWFLGVFLVFLLPGRGDTLRVSYLAVEQGDCAVLQTGELTMLVDAGGSVKNGSERILIPFLKYYGDTRVEYVFLSHADQDHFCMLEELLLLQAEGKQEVVIERLVMPAAGTQEEKYQELVALAKQAGVEVWYQARGERLELGELDIYCLAPEREQETSGTNENSAVLLVKTKRNQYLFTGDVDEAGENKLVAWLTALEAEGGREKLLESEKPCILKVAHHGSRYSSGELFLNWAEPELAIVSCGAENRYGHPHSETLERLEAVGAEVLITWESGAVTIEEKKGRTRVERTKGE